MSAAVAEFKGPYIFGVVRIAQVSMELARIEANFSGLPPGRHGWSINEFGDLTKGAATTGKVFNPSEDEKEVGVTNSLQVTGYFNSLSKFFFDEVPARFANNLSN